MGQDKQYIFLYVYVNIYYKYIEIIIFIFLGCSVRVRPRPRRLRRARLAHPSDPTPSSLAGMYSRKLFSRIFICSFVDFRKLMSYLQIITQTK